jgi:type IV secretion system protein TrbL
MRGASGRPPGRPVSGGQRADFLQRVRNAIPPGTDGHAAGNTPRLSDEI